MMKLGHFYPTDMIKNALLYIFMYMNFCLKLKDVTMGKKELVNVAEVLLSENAL